MDQPPLKIPSNNITKSLMKSLPVVGVKSDLLPVCFCCVYCRNAGGLFAQLLRAAGKQKVSFTASFVALDSQQLGGPASSRTAVESIR